ncbi:hypothetical protein I302_108182 [Kwoniella bestiolae CBS 10118]|uniref:Protein AF-9 homolog n=1 Tax=Kwoniella bestiolae CBS 10118 TaxID=1296100 RepID=A0A1B9FWH1_9TREE|nr:hypothetical protein I302_07452 [Kwoniella bestiolae CBS 10118]OCF23101.1 hypothetical protein I302_07452 [Kwoniella bestiolae CBS 10118]
MSGSERIKGIQVHRPIIYGSHARLLTEEEKLTAPPTHTHRWTVFLTSATSPPLNRLPSGEIEKDDIDTLPGGADDLSYLIKKVTFKLHDTYPTPNRVFDKPPFAVTETGWGEFVVQIRIQFIPESSEKPLTLNHPIKLHHWGLPIEGLAGPSTTTAPPTATNSVVNTPAPDAAPEVLQEPTPDTTPVPPSTDPTDKKEDNEGVKAEEGSTPNPGESSTQQQGEGGAESSSAVLESTQTETEPTDQIVIDPNTQAMLSLPVHSWQYDELIFSDPSKTFLDILNENPPTGLPRINRRAKTQRDEHESTTNNKRSKKNRGRQSVLGSRANTEFQSPTPSLAAGAIGGGAGGELGSADVPLEFSQEMEKGEYNRLAEARRKIVDQMDRWRERLIAQEKELTKLKQEVKGM